MAARKIPADEVLHAAFTDPAVSRETCAAMFGITKCRLFQIAHSRGWFPAEKRPRRGPIRYILRAFTADTCDKLGDPGGASNASPGSDHTQSGKDMRHG